MSGQPAVQYGGHAPTWYAATRNDDTRYPVLQGDTTADVVVVGGGFTGVATALELAERGRDVVLLEAQRIGWGATGRNGGQLIDGFVDVARVERRLGAEAGEAMRAWQFASRDLVVERIQRYAIDCELKSGFLYVAGRAAELRRLAAEYEQRRRDGYPHAMAMLSADGLAERLHSDAYSGALFLGGNGHLHPLNLCLGEARAAAGHGARLFEQSPATRLRHGRDVTIETAGGSVVAPVAVLAGNAYLDGIEPRLRGLVIPAGSYVAATATLDPPLLERLLPRNDAVCETCVGLNYFRRTPDHRLLFGGLCNYSGRDPRRIGAALAPRLASVFPALSGVAFDFEWGGRIAISINRIPQLGRIGDNVYFAQGYSGHGVAPTHVAARLLGAAIDGGSVEFDWLRRVRHWRLPGGRWFANPALAAGMLYYRLREKLGV